jgi:hypothetical protein
MDKIGIYHVAIIGGGAGMVAKILSHRAAVDACPGKRRRAGRAGNCRHNFMRGCSCRCPQRQSLNSAARDNASPARTGSYNVRIGRIAYGVFAALLIVNLTGCAMVSRHQYAEPERDWQSRSGQLMYRTANTRLIGDVVVRFSKSGDFELTFSKGPGVVLLSLRQDANFAEIKGPLARRGWSGPVGQAPQQFHGWLQLRDKIVHSQDRQVVRQVAGAESFLFRF